MNIFDLANEVLSHWNVRLQRLCPEIAMDGSPERCVYRTVLESHDRKFYILERLFPETVAHKRRIAAALEHLARNGAAAVLPYLNLNHGEVIGYYRDSYWQVAPYVAGIPIVRPGYIHDGWRGRALAEFLIELREKSSAVPAFDASDAFSITAFIRDLMEKLETRDPDLHRRVRPAASHLEAGFFTGHDHLPVSFCHGDYHPLNVVWSDRGILAVIDWEFLGYKPEIYDAANLIGCIGMEKPQGLTDDFVFEFVMRLKQAGSLSSRSWACLFEFVLALRFAWLSEWLRKGDVEMIDLEAVYIQLLLENREIFKRSWGV